MLLGQQFGKATEVEPATVIPPSGLWQAVLKETPSRTTKVKNQPAMFILL
jgi:hypothetical protein